MEAICRDVCILKIGNAEKAQEILLESQGKTETVALWNAGFIILSGPSPPSGKQELIAVSSAACRA